MPDETLSAREAAELLCGWPNYSLITWHFRTGRLRQIRVSERKRLYFRTEIEKLKACLDER